MFWASNLEQSCSALLDSVKTLTILVGSWCLYHSGDTQSLQFSWHTHFPGCHWSKIYCQDHRCQLSRNPERGDQIQTSAWVRPKCHLWPYSEKLCVSKLTEQKAGGRTGCDQLYSLGISVVFVTKLSLFQKPFKQQVVEEKPTLQTNQRFSSEVHFDFQLLE